MLDRMSPRFATFVVFLLNGAVFGTWASRVPALAGQIGADVGSLGLALLGASAGLAFTAPLAARICALYGSRGVLIASSLLSPLLLPVLALSQSPLQFGLTLVALGASIAMMDVSMNIAAVVVVRALQRPLMPQFHAGFSVGGLIGSLGSAAAAQAHWTPMKHFLVAACVGLVVTAVIAKNIPGGVGERHREEVAEHANVLKSPVLWLLASVALCSAIAEGAAADWSALFMVRERGMGDAAGAYAYAGFSVAMALARWFGEPIQRRLGPHRLLAAGGGLAATGLALAVVVPLPHGRIRRVRPGRAGARVLVPGGHGSGERDRQTRGRQRRRTPTGPRHDDRLHGLPRRTADRGRARTRQFSRAVARVRGARHGADHPGDLAGQEGR